MVRFFYLLLWVGCCFSSADCRSDSSGVRRPDVTAILIAPNYPDSVYFTVSSALEKSVIKTGSIPGFQSKDTIEHELYYQRMVRRDGAFRLIHVTGSGIRTVNDDKHSVTKIYHFRDSIRFDTLGYFDKPPGDPVDLIPLYPGRAVKIGEQWTPEARVKIAMGEGGAQYVFSTDSLYVEKTGAVMVKVIVNFKGDLRPVPAFAGGTVGISGSGWLLWDCTINQRRESHLQATYTAKSDSGMVVVTVRTDDALQRHSGEIDF